MKLNIILLIIAAISIAFISGCSNKKSIDDSIRTAEMALARGDMESARSVAMNILPPDSTYLGLSAEHLGRLSMIFMHLADNGDESNAAVATDCYRHAFDADSAAAARYYASLPAEQMSTLSLLSNLARHQGMKFSYDHYEMPDSLPSDSI